MPLQCSNLYGVLRTSLLPCASSGLRSGNSFLLSALPALSPFLAMLCKWSLHSFASITLVSALLVLGPSHASEHYLEAALLQLLRRSINDFFAGHRAPGLSLTN